MKRLIVIVLILSLTAILPATSVFAQAGHKSMLISPAFDDEITVSPDQELILAAGWAACTPGLARAYIKDVNYQWKIDGVPILTEEQAAGYWGPIELRDPNAGCLIGIGNLWGSSWRYSIGYLPIGDYEISLTARLNHQLIDGGDWDGDGHLDFFSGVRTDTVTIHVVP